MTMLTCPQERALQQSGLTARCQLPCGCVLLEDDTVIYPHGERCTLAQHDAWLAEVQQQQNVTLTIFYLVRPRDVQMPFKKVACAFWINLKKISYSFRYDPEGPEALEWAFYYQMPLWKAEFFKKKR